LEPVLLVDVLPAREETEELGRADRLDLAAEAVERVTVDAREEPPPAPARPPLEPRAQNGSLAPQPVEERVVPEDRAPPLDAAAQDFLRIARRFRGEIAAVLEDDPTAGAQLVDPRRPGPRLLLGDVADPEQRLVHFLRARGLRPRLLLHAADRLGVERPEIV